MTDQPFRRQHMPPPTNTTGMASIASRSSGLNFSYGAAVGASASSGGMLTSSSSMPTSGGHVDPFSGGMAASYSMDGSPPSAHHHSGGMGQQGPSKGTNYGYTSASAHYAAGANTRGGGAAAVTANDSGAAGPTLSLSLQPPSQLTLSKPEVDAAFNNATATRQRVIVASQALEIQQLQEYCRKQEKEHRERTLTHAKQVDELEQKLNTALIRNRQLEGDVQLLGGKLRAAESRLEVQLAEEQSNMAIAASSSATTREKDDVIYGLKAEITKMRLEYRTIAEEKSVLLQKLLDERSATATVRQRGDAVREENNELQSQIMELTRSLEGAMAKLNYAQQFNQMAERGEGEVTHDASPNSNGGGGRMAALANVFSDPKGFFPVSTGTQTNTEPVVPLEAFESLQLAADEANTAGGHDPFNTAKTITDDLKYLLSVEKGRVAYYATVLADHEANIDALTAALKAHVYAQMQKLHSAQHALRQMMAEMGSDGAASDAAGVPLVMSGSSSYMSDRQGERSMRGPSITTPAHPSTALASRAASNKSGPPPHDDADMANGSSSRALSMPSVAPDEEQQLGGRSGRVTSVKPNGDVDGGVRATQSERQHSRPPTPAEEDGSPADDEANMTIARAGDVGRAKSNSASAVDEHLATTVRNDSMASQRSSTHGGSMRMVEGAAGLNTTSAMPTAAAQDHVAHAYADDDDEDEDAYYRGDGHHGPAAAELSTPQRRGSAGPAGRTPYASGAMLTSQFHQQQQLGRGRTSEANAHQRGPSSRAAVGSSSPPQWDRRTTAGSRQGSGSVSSAAGGRPYTTAATGGSTPTTASHSGSTRTPNSNLVPGHHESEMAALRARLDDLQQEHQAAMRGRPSARGYGSGGRSVGGTSLGGTASTMPQRSAVVGADPFGNNYAAFEQAAIDSGFGGVSFYGGGSGGPHTSGLPGGGVGEPGSILRKMMGGGSGSHRGGML